MPIYMNVQTVNDLQLLGQSYLLKHELFHSLLLHGCYYRPVNITPLTSEKQKRMKSQKVSHNNLFLTETSYLTGLMVVILNQWQYSNKVLWFTKE